MHPSSTTPVMRTRRSKPARRPRVGMRSRPRMRRKIKTHAGRRRTRKTSTATRTSSVDRKHKIIRRYAETDEAVAVQHGVDGALGGNTHVGGQAADKQLTDLPYSPV